MAFFIANTNTIDAINPNQFQNIPNLNFIPVIPVAHMNQIQPSSCINTNMLSNIQGQTHTQGPIQFLAPIQIFPEQSLVIPQNSPNIQSLLQQTSVLNETANINHNQSTTQHAVGMTNNNSEINTLGLNMNMHFQHDQDADMNLAQIINSL